MTYQKNLKNEPAIGLPAGCTAAKSDDRWADCAAALRSASPARAHHGHSWCLETDPDTPAARMAFSLHQDSWDCFYAALRSKQVGFRPVLTLPEDHGMEDGQIFHRYALTMDGKLAYTRMSTRHGVRSYRPGAELRFVDHVQDERAQIPWVVYGNHAIAAENLLVNISWNDLNALGFAR